MKDANGSHFELLLGASDWGRCAIEEGDAQRTLAQAWAEPSSRSGVALSFDAEAQMLSLAPRISRFRAPKSDTPPDARRRLGAVCDAFGSVYWVAQSGERIDVWSVGSRGVSEYARGNVETEALPPALGAFSALVPVPAPESRRLRGLAITSEHFLVAGLLPRAGLAGGLRVFDLVGGGPPLEIVWPSAWAFEPHDLAPRCCGGLAVLDRQNRRVWLLDRRLAQQADFTVEVGAPAQQDVFVAADGTTVPRPLPTTSPSRFDLVLEADGTGGDPLAIEVLADGAVLVMDGAGSDGFALLSLYEAGVLVARVSTRVVLDVLDTDEREGFVLRGYDCALVPRPEREPERLVIAAHDGNQCFAFDLLRGSPGLLLDPVESFLPMRRFEGKGLARRAASTADLRVQEDSGLLYDGMGTWLPLVTQVRPRYELEAVLQTPALDSNEPDCVWHRLVIDGCVPPGCTLGVETRAADDEQDLVDLRFQREPAPVLRLDGVELPWLSEDAWAATDVIRGRGSWELLFQRAHGRYLQIRLTLSGNELSTPRLRALRAWCPRFSYARQYLPAVYREDETSAHFLERFLANFEGIFTQLEDRIACAAALFDVRSAPTETLEWLASWLGLVLDPALPAARKRLLIRFALPLFEYRGTTQGVRLATELALSACINPEDFALPDRSQHQPYGIRIIERYLTRRLPPALLGETVIESPRLVPFANRWTPAEGTEGLHQRYREALEQAGVAGAETAQFTPLSPEDAAQAEVWRSVSTAELGVVPGLAHALAARWRDFLAMRATKGDGERRAMQTAIPRTWPSDPDQQTEWRTFLKALPGELRRWLSRWQGFLERRYLRMDAYAAAWGGTFPDFALVPAPDVLPTGAVALSDWALFETRLETMAQAAHRFSVLLPSNGPLEDTTQLAQRIDWAQRVVRLEKPAHTAFDVRPYWAMFRIGQARVGLDSLLGMGSRAPELLPEIIVGSGHVGAGRIAHRLHAPRGRVLLAC